MGKITEPENKIKKKQYSTPSVKVLSTDAALSRLEQAALAGDAGAKEMLDVHDRIFGARRSLGSHIDYIRAKLETAFQALKLSKTRKTRKERTTIVQKMLSLLEDADHIGLPKKARPALKRRPATHS